MKKVIITVFLAICLATVLLTICFMEYDDTINGEFDFDADSSCSDNIYLSDSYSSIVQRPSFQSDAVLGKIEGPLQLRREAQKIWISIYGLKILCQKPYEVLYDPDNDIWLVRGTTSQDTQGGTAHILVDDETGKVLAVWHYS